VAAGIVGIFKAATTSPRSVPVAMVAQVPALAAAPAPEVQQGGVPVISIDSLPVAPSAEPAHGTGRLLIGATPGWCTISIDGMKRGPTPLPAIDLSPGLHVLRCEAPNGKVKTDSIYVKDGATARHRFTLD
jgi:hypothetical protein